MARRLARVLMGIGKRAPRTAFKTGQVREVTGTGHVVTELNGKVVTTTPITDLPHKAGDIVLIADSDRGPVAYGKA